MGWISVPADAPPVRVTLHLDKLRLASTFATVSDTMSGAAADPAARTPPGSLPLVHSWQQPNLPGPAGDRRNSRQQVRTFSFRVREIWPFVNRRTKITVRVNGRPLPVYGHGMYLNPPRNGRRSVRELRRMLDSGYVLSQFGRIQLSKKLDTGWQLQVVSLYERVRKIVAKEYGHDLFLVYGTLLGVVREGGYIGHDVDFDTAYVSGASTGPAAAEELADLGVTLVAHGLSVEPMVTTLHVFDPEDRSARIDVFHTYFDGDGVMRFPFGIAGTSRLTAADWRGCQEVEFEGGHGLVPVNAAQMVAHLYGDDWRQPKPGFNWNLDRTDKAVEGELTPAQRSRVYWADFYARVEFTEGSTFFELVNARSDMPASVVDIGCGDGRDACSFAAAGRQVLGLDQSDVAIEHARAHAARLGRGSTAFEVCDVTDHERLSGLVSQHLRRAEGPVLYYLRFFLHSIPAEVQDGLLRLIAGHARPGDLFAAEFRTDLDAERAKVHGRHYRRFQNGPAFGRELSGTYGFTLVHEEEGTGLSPYRGEDPVLYRVVARR